MTPSPVRVLLVEDNPGDAELTRETLEAGKLLVDITVAVDGAQAVELALGRGAYSGRSPFDLIVLDLNLPKLDGRAVIAELRRHPITAATPLVILTSSAAERDIGESYRLGANCYVTKPIGLRAFQDIVRSIEQFWFTVVRLP